MFCLGSASGQYDQIFGKSIGGINQYLKNYQNISHGSRVMAIFILRSVASDLGQHCLPVPTLSPVQALQISSLTQHSDVTTKIVQL